MNPVESDKVALEAKELDVVALGSCKRQVFEVRTCLRLEFPQRGKPKTLADPYLFWRVERLSIHCTCNLSLSSRLKQVTSYFEYLVQHPVDISRRPLFTYSDRDQECLHYFPFARLEFPE